MNRRAWFFLFAFSLLVGGYAISKMQTAQAQKTSAADNPAKAKWEYCAIVGAGTLNENDMAVGVATVVYFDASGYREEQVRAQGGRLLPASTGEYERARKQALAITIAQLGGQGWEMIGDFPYNGGFRAGAD